MGLEVLYGGAAGGGKSSSLLMAALQFVSIPNYSAIIFRQSYTDLSLPGALMDRAHEWLGDTDAKWNPTTKTWHFPSGSTLSFGYLEKVTDRYRYQSSEFQFVGFDELTQFKERDYTYLFSRLRRTKDVNVPLRMRAGTNPGGVGHIWVKKRFLSEYAVHNNITFVPAKMDDNPHLDRVEYRASLNKLDTFTRKQLEEGRWDDFQGNYFYPASWPKYQPNHADPAVTDAFYVKRGEQRAGYLRRDMVVIVGVDWALNKVRRRKPGEMPEWAGDSEKASDFCAMVVAGLTHDGQLFMLDCVNDRIRMEHKGPRLAELCRRWRPDIVATDDDMIGETMLLECRRHRDIPEVMILPIEGKAKAVRAMAAIIRGQNWLINLPEFAPWLEMFCDCLVSFTGVDDEHDDVPDALGIVARVADDIKGDNRPAAQPEVYSGRADTYGPNVPQATPPVANAGVDWWSTQYGDEPPSTKDMSWY